MKALVLESAGAGEINHVHAGHVGIALRRHEFVGDEVGHKVAHDHRRRRGLLVRVGAVQVCPVIRCWSLRRVFPDRVVVVCRRRRWTRSRGRLVMRAEETFRSHR